MSRRDVRQRDTLHCVHLQHKFPYTQTPLLRFVVENVCHTASLMPHGYRVRRHTAGYGDAVPLRHYSPCQLTIIYLYV